MWDLGLLRPPPELPPAPLQLTHGGMAYGAGKFAADKYGAAEVVDPRPYLVGSLLCTLHKYRSLGKLIPAMVRSGRLPQAPPAGGARPFSCVSHDCQ